ncbi:MAG: hypothetical protein K2P69_10735 [Eubacterium sp.]|nr:hypothetical protein [Eubacterium sp.]
MLLEKKSRTIRTQKNTISEQEKIIRRQVLDIGEQRRTIAELRGYLKQNRTDMVQTK